MHMRNVVAAVCCLCVVYPSMLPAASGETYAPGIPLPPGCLAASPPPLPPQWPADSAAGFYYVDNRSDDATDEDNPFGTGKRPRLTIPQELQAGSYVELHGGPYVATRMVTIGLGTAAEPVWISGESHERPTVIRAPWYITGQHVILRHVAFDTTRKTLGIIDGTGICIRNNRFSGPRTSSGNSAVVYIAGRAPGASKDNVIYGNVIRDFGDVESRRENDYHGILVDGYTESTWILDNDISGNAGDGVQVGNTSFDRDERPRLVYIARNRMQGNRENAVDVKRAADVIVSSNKILGYRATSSSEGAGIVIHNDPEQIWVIGNDVSDSDIGIITTGSMDTWFVGNVIYDIAHHSPDWDPDSGYASGAAMHFRGDSSGGAVGNTVAYYDVGLQLTQGSRAGYAVHNNIFAYRQAAAGDDIRVASGPFTRALTISDNLLFGDSAGFRVTWSGRSYRSPKELQAATGLFSHTLTADPQFIDPDGRNFRPGDASPAIGAGVEPDIGERFRRRYGIELKLDERK